MKFFFTALENFRRKRSEHFNWGILIRKWIKNDSATEYVYNPFSNLELDYFEMKFNFTEIIANHLNKSTEKISQSQRSEEDWNLRIKTFSVIKFIIKGIFIRN